MSEGSQPSSSHRGIVLALQFVATFLTFVAIFAFWVNRQALNTDGWVNTSSKLLQNKAIDSQLSSFLVNQLYAHVDVEAELEKRLPPVAKALAGPAAGGLRQLAQQVSERALATPQVQSLWAEANRGAHQALLKVIEGGGPAVSTSEGHVTLQVGPLVKQVGERVGLPSALISKLPPEAGSFTVLNSKQLSTTQKIAKAIRELPILFTALLILLYGGAIYLARGRRREAVRATGFGFIVAGVLALLVRSIAGNSIVGSLVHTAAVKPAAEAAWDIGTSLLVTIAVSTIAFGILAVIGAWLAGKTTPARALRREAAPYLREHRGASYGVAAAIWLALIAWAPITAFRKPFGILLFAVLFAIGTEVLRRQTLKEFPEGRSGQLKERIRALASRSPEKPSGKLDELERLSALRREGALSEEEFAAQKAKLLA
jgi:hypothetical protein